MANERSSNLGAVFDGRGVRFRVISQGAEAIELCLFDHCEPRSELRRVPLRRVERDVWETYLAGSGPGALYGYRTHGPYAPTDGHWFNPYKLLTDPYARAITGEINWADAVYGYSYGTAKADLSIDSRDSAPFVPRSVVVDSSFDWQSDEFPHVSWAETVIYECHVKGMTWLHPEVPAKLRGTYLGLASEPILEYLRRLNVTAVELLPVHHSVTRRWLVECGLENYWGYDTLAFFAPDARFATGSVGQQVIEFKEMVRRFHVAGIEVILDVVFNHTVEGDQNGPTLSFRGLDNANYYLLDPRNKGEYINLTGCGNTLNVEHPRTMQLVLDSLRYWVGHMHVDGFRFDLATVLAFGSDRFSAEARFFEAIRQDPVLSRVKLIAEPWDASFNSHRLGQFPADWAEWNDRYRDDVRRFWRGDQGLIGSLATRLAGSSEIFSRKSGTPLVGINHITSHDGFTLHDLVSYDRKHNAANGENGHDGSAENFSQNWGAEGPTGNQEVVVLREQIKRNFLATLVFSQGVPMITAGDEIGRTQLGNNNAYAQDNEVSWMNWELDSNAKALLEFVRSILSIRRAHASFRRERFFFGTVACSCGLKDVTWLNPLGTEMGEKDWQDATRRALGMMIHTHHHETTDGEKEAGNGAETFLLLVNADHNPISFRLPLLTDQKEWRRLVNTGQRNDEKESGEPVQRLLPHSFMLLKC